MSELQRTYNHESYLATRQIIDHDVFVNMSAGESRVRAITDVLDHYCNITGKYDKMTPTQKYAFLDEIGAQIDLAIDNARLDIGYIVKENNDGRDNEEAIGSRTGDECYDREGEEPDLSGNEYFSGEAGGAEISGAGVYDADKGDYEED